MIEVLGGSTPAKLPDVPGPSVLATGNLDAGYYGLVPSNEFISYSVLNGLLGITGATNDGQPWVKMSYKGKVTFYSQKTTHSSITLSAANTQMILNDTKIVTILGRKYSVRAMKIMVTEPYGGGGSPGGAAIRGTEYTDLLCRMCNVTTDTEVGEKLGSFTLTELGITSTLTRSLGTSGRAVVGGTPTDITWIDRIATNVGRAYRPVLTLIE